MTKLCTIIKAVAAGRNPFVNQVFVVSVNILAANDAHIVESQSLRKSGLCRPRPGKGVENEKNEIVAIPS